MSNHREPPEVIAPPLASNEFYANPFARMLFMRDMFNHTAQHYDAANRLVSLGSGVLYRRTCLRWAGLRPGMKVVDVAVGTDLLTREIVRVTGEC